MRLVRLLRLAGEAEALRWRRNGRRLATRAVLGAAAGLFAALLLVMLHIAALAWLAPGRGVAAAALVIGGVDLALALALGWLAGRAGEDRVAVEAARVRDHALSLVGDSMARAAVLAPLLRSRSARKGLVASAAVAAVLGFLNRR